MPRRAPALGSGLTVLQLLASIGPQPAAALARRLELPRSSTYHLLSVLVETGFVTHYPGEQQYGLGVAAFEIGTAYLRQARLERLGRPVLARLVSTTKATAHLGILLGHDLLYLLKHEPVRPVPLITDVGVRLPAHLTASGRALLAGLPAAELAAIYPPGAHLADRTGRGPRTVTELRRLLTQERDAGVSVEQGHITPGIASIAAAARDRTGRPIAAVAVSVRASDLGSLRGRLTDAVLATAATLTARLR